MCFWCIGSILNMFLFLQQMSYKLLKNLPKQFKKRCEIVPPQTFQTCPQQLPQTFPNHLPNLPNIQVGLGDLHEWIKNNIGKKGSFPPRQPDETYAPEPPPCQFLVFCFIGIPHCLHPKTPSGTLIHLCFRGLTA